jgi:hypothetical protein
MNFKITIEFDKIEQLKEFSGEFAKLNLEELDNYNDIITVFEDTFELNEINKEPKQENRGIKTKELHQKARQMYQHANPQNLTYHQCFKLISEKNNNLMNENI